MLGRVSTPDATTSRSLIHHPDFRRLWTGDALGQLGAQLTALALPILAVQQLAATEWEMGVLTAAEYAAFLRHRPARGRLGGPDAQAPRAHRRGPRPRRRPRPPSS